MTAPSHIRADVSSDGIIFLDTRRGVLLSANLVGARIWERLLAGWSESQIAEQISLEWRADRAVVERDVRDFVQSLMDREILVHG